MNNRTRQWFKASAMLDRYDPQIMATVPYKGETRAVMIFRRSKLEEMREKYKGLHILFDGERMEDEQ